MVTAKGMVCYSTGKKKKKIYLGHVREPQQNGVDTFKVITYCGMGHPIIVHDLDAPQLVIGSVHLSSKNLFEVGEEKIDLLLTYEAAFYRFSLMKCNK